MKKIKYFITIILLCSSSYSYAETRSFEEWLKLFKKKALENNISEETFIKTMSSVKYLPKVIKYDRFQPEFYEDTITYISKRTSKKKILSGIKLYEKNYKTIDAIQDKFSVEKELLLSLMGIETNFGTYVGKMDILSSLATLSFDKRRSDFFTNELITILQLVESKTIDHKILYGSWAGAYGNFQFMPTSIKKYAIDYNMNNKIELKNIEDSFASAANYMKKINWKKDEPCFLKIDLSSNIPKKFLNTSAQKIKNKKKLSFFENYIDNYEDINVNKNYMVGIITPDKDIIENSNNFKPAYIVFDNYELILKWNRSLRFALAVCTLKRSFENVL
ncbi:lytic murein transglycosylase [Candidatus Pelagibacter sp.]|nr:lytic murein transglycosylase [Candidatus Pelagibacter sp.]